MNIFKRGVVTMWTLNLLVIAGLLLFSVYAQAAKKGTPVSNKSCTALVLDCMSDPKASYAHTSSKSACCSRKLKYCVVVPNDPAKSCTKHKYSIGLKRYRFNKASLYQMKRNLNKRNIRRRPAPVRLKQR